MARGLREVREVNTFSNGATMQNHKAEMAAERIYQKIVRDNSRRVVFISGDGSVRTIGVNEADKVPVRRVIGVYDARVAIDDLASDIAYCINLA